MNALASKAPDRGQPGQEARQHVLREAPEPHHTYVHAAQLASRDLTFESWTLEPQLGDLVRLARAFPQVTIVVNHCGAPLGVGRYAGTQKERFQIWQKSIDELARCSNTIMKVGGLGTPFCGFGSYLSNAPSSKLASEWRPYVEACIEAFGHDRCTFESNYPVDAGTATYPLIWNSFKTIMSERHADEKAALFHGTATRVYGLPKSLTS